MPVENGKEVFKLARETAGREKITAQHQRLTAADQKIDLRAELKALRLGPCKMIVVDELP